MSLVTVHVPAGGTLQALIREFTELAGGVRPRTVSGRVGVLVDAELAYHYLATRYAPVAEPEPAPVVVAAPEPQAPVVAEVPPPPVKKAPAKKAAAKPAAGKGE